MADDPLIVAMKKGESLWCRIGSGSMAPLLRTDDPILVVPLESPAMTEIPLGTVVVFRRHDRWYGHRLVARSRQARTQYQYRERSDAFLISSPLRAEAIIGLVVAVYRNGQVIQLDSSVGRICGASLVAWGGMLEWLCMRLCGSTRAPLTGHRRTMRALLRRLARLGGAAMVLVLSCLSRWHLSTPVSPPLVEVVDDRPRVRSIDRESIDPEEMMVD